MISRIRYPARYREALVIHKVPFNSGFKLVSLPQGIRIESHKHVAHGSGEIKYASLLAYMTTRKVFPF